MAMFRREQPEAKTAAPAPPHTGAERRATPAVVAPGCKVTGKVGGTADVQIDGEVEGEIVTQTSVTIGNTGQVRGEIAARAVRIAGKMFGNVRGSDRVEVLASGTLEGDVAAPRVVIAEGAFFKGKVEMTGAAKKETA